MYLQVILKAAGELRWEGCLIGLVLLNNGSVKPLGVELSLLVRKLTEQVFPLGPGYHEIIDVEFLHDVVELIEIDGFSPHPIDIEGLLQLGELVLEYHVDLLLKVLGGLMTLLPQLQGGEMDIVLGHQLNELLKVDLLAGACQLEHQSRLIRGDIISILLDNTLQLCDANLALASIGIKVVLQMPFIPVILDKSPLELVQFVETDLLILELSYHIFNLFIKVMGEVKLGYGLLEMPPALTAFLL